MAVESATSRFYAKVSGHCVSHLICSDVRGPFRYVSNISSAIKEIVFYSFSSIYLFRLYAVSAAQYIVGTLEIFNKGCKDISFFVQTYESITTLYFLLYG